MGYICQITGKRPARGSIIHRKGQSKKSGGIGTHVTAITKRYFKPNVQRVRVLQPDGTVKRMYVCVRAIKSGLIKKPGPGAKLARPPQKRRGFVYIPPKNPKPAAAEAPKA
jgi:large subunit ribosomal protein L28